MVIATRWFVALIVLLFPFRESLAAETIISKADVDLIFSMQKAEWEAYAPHIADPQWKVRLKKIDTGVGVMAFDPSTGMGLLIQPLYIDSKSPPTMLVIGSFYPLGKGPLALEKTTKQVEQEAQQNLGDVYVVSARYVRMPPSLEGIELSMTQAEKR